MKVTPIKLLTSLVIAGVVTTTLICFVQLQRAPVVSESETLLSPAAVAGEPNSFCPTVSAMSPRPGGELPETIPGWRLRLQQTLALPKEVQSDVGMEDLAREIPADEISGVLDQIVKFEGGTPGTTLGPMLLQRWSEQAPAAAATWVQQLPDDPRVRNAFRQVATAWASVNVTNAIAWLDQLPASDNKTAAQLSIATTAAMQHNAATAVALAFALPANAERDQVLNYSVLQWAGADRASAVAWVNQSPDAAWREETLSRMAVQWGIEAPAQAASFAATALAGGVAQDDAVLNIVRFWTAAEPEQSGAWVKQFPAGNLRDAALNHLIAVWARSDVAGAANWLNELPPGQARDVAVSTYVPFLAAPFPEQAAFWAESIQDETLRVRTLENLRVR